MLIPLAIIPHHDPFPLCFPLTPAPSRHCRSLLLPGYMPAAKWGSCGFAEPLRPGRVAVWVNPSPTMATSLRARSQSAAYTVPFSPIFSLVRSLCSSPCLSPLLVSPAHLQVTAAVWTSPIMSSLPPYHPDQPEPSLSVSWDDSCPVTSDRDVLQAMSTSESVEVVHRERPPLKRERLAPLRSSNSQATDGKVSAPHGGDMSLPPVILGCAAFGYNIYAKEDDVMSDLPLKLVKQALDAGVSAFDTCEYVTGFARS